MDRQKPARNGPSKFSRSALEIEVSPSRKGAQIIPTSAEPCIGIGGMPIMRKYTLEYLFNGEPRIQLFELKQPQLPVHEAAMHLLQLHFGDAENSLIMPNADASPAEILEQAERVGLTQINVIDQPG